MPERTTQPGKGARRGRATRPGPRPDDAASGFIADVVPVMRDGLVVLRTLVDLAIQRLDEIEEGRTAHARRETYETILGVLDEEIERLAAEPSSDAVDAQLDALRSIRNVIERQLRHATAPAGKTNGKDGDAKKKPRKRTVTID